MINEMETKDVRIDKQFLWRLTRPTIGHSYMLVAHGKRPIVSVGWSGNWSCETPQKFIGLNRIKRLIPCLRFCEAGMSGIRYSGTLLWPVSQRPDQKSRQEKVMEVRGLLDS